MEPLRINVTTRKSESNDQGISRVPGEHSWRHQKIMESWKISSSLTWTFTYDYDDALMFRLFSFNLSLHPTLSRRSKLREKQFFHLSVNWKTSEKLLSHIVLSLFSCRTAVTRLQFA